MIAFLLLQAHLLSAWIHKFDVSGDKQGHLTSHTRSRKIVCFANQLLHVNWVSQSYQKQQLFHISGSDPQQSPSYAPGNFQ